MSIYFVVCFQFVLDKMNYCDSGVTDGTQGYAPLPGKLNVKTGPPPGLYFGIWCYFGFQQVVIFLRFFWSVFR